MKCLNRLRGERRKYKAKLTGKADPSWSNIPQELELKKGCLIQLLYNDFELGFANGDTAVVEELWPDSIYIQLLRKQRQLFLRPRKLYNFGFTSKGFRKTKPDGTLNVIHARLAYALTIHKCLSGDTLVSTNKGLVKLSSVHKGDLINTGQGDYKVIKLKSKTEPKKVVNLETKQGYSIKTSEEHKLLVMSNGNLVYKKSKNLIAGSDYLCIDRRVQIFGINKENLDVDMAWWLGAVIGDGSYKGSTKAVNSINFTNQDKECLDKYISILNRFKVKYTIKNTKNKTYRIDYCDKNFRNILLALGLARVSKIDKDIPGAIFSSTIECRGSFISGLFDTNGHCKNQLSYTSISITLIRNVQILLNTLGIISYYKKENNAYKLIITPTSYLNFKKYVGFNVKYKQNALNNICSRYPKTNIDIIPYDIKKLIKEDIYNQLPPNCRNTKDKKGLHYNKYTKGIFNNKNNLTYKMLDRVVDYYKEFNLEIPLFLQRIITNNYFYSPIVKIEYQESKCLYDIEVGDDNTFWANGIVSHNSQGLTLDKVQLNLKGLGTAFLARQSGMLYTALSRVRTPEGLVIVGTIDDLMRCIYVDNRYKKWIR